MREIAQRRERPDLGALRELDRSTRSSARGSRAGRASAATNTSTAGSRLQCRKVRLVDEAGARWRVTASDGAAGARRAPARVPARYSGSGGSAPVLRPFLRNSSSISFAARVERLAGAHFADQRLVEAQAEDLLDLRAFGVAQFLLARTSASRDTPASSAAAAAWRDRTCRRRCGSGCRRPRANARCAS